MRHNKTYKKQPTKRQVKQRNQNRTIALFLLVFFFLAGIDASQSLQLAKQSNTIKDIQHQTNANARTIEDLTIIKLQSKHFEAETIAYEASTKACNKHAINATPEQLNDCITDLIGIMATETGNTFHAKAIGDNGNSHGIMQINRYYHPHVSIEQAQDPFFSADYTLARMIKYNYKTDRDGAIRKHNGSRTNPRTLTYLNKVNYYKALYN